MITYVSFFTLYDDMNVFQIFKDLQKNSEFKVSIFFILFTLCNERFILISLELGGEKGSSPLVKRISPSRWWRNKHLRITWTGHFLLTSAYYCRSLLWNVCVNFGLIFNRYSDAILSSKSLFCTRELKETRKHVMKVTKLKIKRGNDIIDKIPH